MRRLRFCFFVSVSVTLSVLSGNPPIFMGGIWIGILCGGLDSKAGRERSRTPCSASAGAAISAHRAESASGGVISRAEPPPRRRAGSVVSIHDPAVTGRVIASAILYANYDASLKRGAMFDSRAFSVPKEEVCNCLIWRQQDATRNSIEAVGQANFSHHELHKKTCNMIQEMLWSQRGINWNDFPTELKRGSCCIKRRFEETIDDPRNPGQKITVCRNRWIIDHEIPIFTQDREYLERLI